MKLSTIQKHEKLNTIEVHGETSKGGAYHTYEINSGDTLKEKFSIFIPFQEGARKLIDSSHGILDTDLLEIVRHRLQCFQCGEFATRENAIALTHIEEALLWLNKRVEDRIEKGILGTMQK